MLNYRYMRLTLCDHSSTRSRRSTLACILPTVISCTLPTVLMSSLRTSLFPEIWASILAHLAVDEWHVIGDVSPAARQAADHLVRKLQRRYVDRWRKNMVHIRRLGPVISLAAVERGRRFERPITFQPGTWQRHQARIRCPWDWLAVGPLLYRRPNGYWDAFARSNEPGNITDAVYVRGENIRKVELLTGGCLLWTSHRLLRDDRICVYLPFILPLPGRMQCDILCRVYADSVFDVQYRCGFLNRDHRSKNLLSDVKVWLTADGMTGVRIGSGERPYFIVERT